MMRTPIGAKFTHQIAFGTPGIRVTNELFTQNGKV